jgi:hypothetical protein
LTVSKVDAKNAAIILKLEKIYTRKFQMIKSLLAKVLEDTVSCLFSLRYLACTSFTENKSKYPGPSLVAKRLCGVTLEISDLV